MRRLIFVIVFISVLIQPVNIFAESISSLTYERSVSLLKSNNAALKKLKRAEDDAYRQYNSNLLYAGTIDINGFTIKFDDKDMYITYDPDTKQSMKKVKELYPEQMKFSWEASKSNHTITENSLSVNLRGVFFSLYNSQSTLQLNRRQLEFAKEVNSQDKLKLKRGMITDLDMQMSDYNLDKAQKDVVSAQRNYSNAERNFNQFVGLPSATQYTRTVFEDTLRHPEWKPVSYYIDEALDNRFDILSIRKQLELKELDKKITEAGNLYQNNTVTKDEYERLLNDIEQLKLDLAETQLSITNEIKNSYTDVIKTGKGLDNLYESLKLQQKGYEKMQERYKAGLVSRNLLTQTEIQLQKMTCSCEAALFDYNTRIIRFNYATGIGPGY